jgi:hypothetical protein
VIGISGWGSVVAPVGDGRNDAELLRPAVEQALGGRPVDVLVTAGSEFLTGAVGTVMGLFDVLPGWPPRTHTHLEGDGAFALHEAWIRLLAGGGRSALVAACGRPLAHDLEDVLALQLDPYVVGPLGVRRRHLAAMQAQLLGAELEALPVRAGAAAVLLTVDEGVPIAGIQQRVEASGIGRRDLRTSASTREAAEALGLPRTRLDLLAVHAQHEHERTLVAAAVGAEVSRVVAPTSQVPMVTGLLSLIAAAESGGRVVAHASNGPCLQHNLLCLLESA